MREIKFRAWDRKEKKMCTEAMEILNIGLGDGSVCITSEAQKGNELDWIQYTGLKDKDKKEIWEGDILLNPFFGDLWEVRWNKKYGHWEVHQMSDDINEELGHINFKVIGNIYENKELLK